MLLGMDFRDIRRSARTVTRHALLHLGEALGAAGRRR
jgi:hypothetical protein